MKETWRIAHWEVMRNLRNKQFLVGLILTPLIIALFSGVPRLLERWDQPQIVTYYVIDTIGGQAWLEEAAPANLKLPLWNDDPADAQAAVLGNQADGYFVIDEAFIETGHVDLMYNKRHNEAVHSVNVLLSTLLQHRRLQAADMDPGELQYLTAEAQVSAVALEEAAAPGGDRVVVSIAFLVLVYFLIFSSGAMLMQSASQEKRDRMAELILSSITPIQLMQGKILGHFLLGLIQMVFWVALGLPAVIFLLEFDVWGALAQVDLPLLLFFSLFGYLLFSALFVSMGATIEDLQSAGNSQALVIMLPMLSFVVAGPVVGNPDGVIAQFASIFPLTSPAMMIMRTAITNVPRAQILLSGFLLLLTTAVIVKLAARIFRVGMLMYGKTADLSEILKWLRHKDA